MENRFSLPVYNGRIFGHSITQKSLNDGELSYRDLSDILSDVFGGCILNNDLFGMFSEGFEDYSGSLYDDETGEYMDVCQWYIVSVSGAAWLHDLGMPVVYNPDLGIHLLAVDHLGTAWDYVSTGIKLYNA